MTKVALVTGASRGIGAAIALQLAGDGYDVCVNFFSHEDKAHEVVEKIQMMGRRAIAVKADVSDLEQVGKMYETVKARLGEVDLLVNNAGIARQMQIQDVAKEDWDRFMGVNVTGAYNNVHFALPHMLKEHKGCIIMISSMWGLRGASCESVYSATKAAIIGFARSLANELAPTGIRVNCVAPGVIDTEMMDEYTDEDKASLAQETPLGRLGTPEDIAGVVSFLSSDSAGFITGQVITADGGFSV